MFRDTGSVDAQDTTQWQYFVNTTLNVWVSLE